MQIHRPAAERGRPVTDRKRAALAVAGWTALLAVAWLLGQWKDAITDKSLKLGAMPLFGRWEWHLDPTLLAPVAVGALLIAVLPPLARRARWRWAVLGAAAGQAAFSLALALAHSAPWTWIDVQNHYSGQIGEIDDAGGPAAFLETYTDVQRTGEFKIHLQSHPPGLILFFWAANRIGLSGPLFDNTVTMLAAAAMTVAALLIGREIAGETLTRRALPFLVIAPAAFWHTNADIIFGGVTLTAVACLILATGRTGARAAWLTAAGGLLAGAAMMLSFSSVLLAIPFLVVAVMRRRWAVIAGGGAVAAAVVLAPLLWGYWWLDGMSATRERYYAGVASVRGYWYFLLGNLAILALALGPAIAAALAGLRDRAMWIVVGSTLAAVAIADVSGMSSSEVERIWQPFMPLVLLAGCALLRTRAWLSLQLAVPLILTVTLRTPW